MIRYIFGFALALTTLTAAAQHLLTARIADYPRQQVHVCQQDGDDSKLLETVVTDVNGAFFFSFDKQKCGLYRFFLDNDSHFDIIYNNEDIELTTKSSNPDYEMHIFKSNENIQFYTYLQKNIALEYRWNILTKLASIYPEGDFYDDIEAEMKRVRKQKNANIEAAIRMQRGSLTAAYLPYFKELHVPNGSNAAKRHDLIREQFFAQCPFDNVALLNTNAYTHAVVAYFEMFHTTDPNVFYAAACDILDHVFLRDSKIFDYVFEYILAGFETLEMHEPAAQLSVEYGNKCSDDDENLKMRIKSNIELSIGKKAPDIDCETVAGDIFTLSQMQHAYTLVIFWATWCEHCKVTLPKLIAMKPLLEQANMDVVAVSIDTDKHELDNYLSVNALPWPVICGYDGWNSKTVVDYAVYATPTIFIVDANMHIVAKPLDEKAVAVELQNIIKTNDRL